MYKSAAEWKEVWPSFESHSIEHIERALIALSAQLGIESLEEHGRTVFSQHVAQFLDRVLEEAKKNDEPLLS
ncbi:MAG: hypothetical protein EOP07_04195 [Proteobacteria bacterium]|nr:MAG: hypothetical protein EOP07_04195 [Pseudomonadota bacterium]